MLPDLILPSRANQLWKYSGIDCLQECKDKKLFNKYPYCVEYRYNSRGFRDQEWPNSLQEMQSSVWCIGDSFTVGIGQPSDHTWPQILSTSQELRTINVSMDGASNQWIARRCVDIMRDVDPKNMIVMWTYIHRRENPDITLDDENRRLHYIGTTEDEDIEDFFNCVDLINQNQTSTNIIYLAIPGFYERLVEKDIETLYQEIYSIWNNIRGETWPEFPPMSQDELGSLPEFIISEIKLQHQCYDMLLSKILHHDRLIRSDIKSDSLLKGKFQEHIDRHILQVPILDLARDGYHFDKITSRWVAEKVGPLLELP